MKQMAASYDGKGLSMNTESAVSVIECLFTATPCQARGVSPAARSRPPRNAGSACVTETVAPVFPALQRLSHYRGRLVYFRPRCGGGVFWPAAAQPGTN